MIHIRIVHPQFNFCFDPSFLGNGLKKKKKDELNVTHQQHGSSW